MPFSREIEKAWTRSKGKCECSRKGHGHVDRCNAVLKHNEKARPHARKEEKGSWDIRLYNSRGPEEASNFEILCIHGNNCYQKSIQKKSVTINQLL